MIFFIEGDITGIPPQKIPIATDTEDALEDDVCYYIFGQFSTLQN